MLLTIFTPTYNRAYTLPKLFESLKSQTSKDFEWLIVDDGSADETETLIRDYRLQVADCSQKNQGFEIRYFKQENGGKHRAINRGLKEARGELFFIVDSDDFLAPDAVEWIGREFEAIRDDERFAGLSGIRITPDGKKIGGDKDFGTIDATALEIRRVHHVQGDLAEMFKTSVLRKYPFLEVEGERFCPEALVWNRIALRYMLRFVHKGIYVCDYLPDGLTAKIVQIRHRSPLASMTFYAELFGYEQTFRLKVRAAINFWRFFHVKHFDKLPEMKMLNALSLLSMPLGMSAHIVDFLKREV